MNMYFDPLYWARVSHDDFDGDSMTVIPMEEKEKTPKCYLTTHNPYMSEDWKKKFLEEYWKPHVWDVDVNSMYPMYVMPARGSGKTSPYLKMLIEMAKAQNKLLSRPNMALCSTYDIYALMKKGEQTDGEK